MMKILTLSSFLVISCHFSDSQNIKENRGFGSSIWGQVQQVGSQWVKSVQNSVGEIGKVAKVLAGDASDAVSTVSLLFHENFQC